MKQLMCGGTSAAALLSICIVGHACAIVHATLVKRAGSISALLPAPARSFLVGNGSSSHSSARCRLALSDARNANYCFTAQRCVGGEGVRASQLFSTTPFAPASRQRCVEVEVIQAFA